jgi:hypothetical protein
MQPVLPLLPSISSPIIFSSYATLNWRNFNYQWQVPTKWVLKASTKAESLNVPCICDISNWLPSDLMERYNTVSLHMTSHVRLKDLI